LRAIECGAKTIERGGIAVIAFDITDPTRKGRESMPIQTAVAYEAVADPRAQAFDAPALARDSITGMSSSPRRTSACKAG
jgi:hypothetical protein